MCDWGVVDTWPGEARRCAAKIECPQMDLPASRWVQVSERTAEEVEEAG